MRLIVADLPVAQPFLKRAQKIIVGKLLAPDGRKLPACFDERSVEIEQADQSWPLTGPVSYRKNWPLMATQTGQHMMTVLPRRGRKNQSGFEMNIHKNIHTHALRRDESVLLRLVVGMGAHKFDALLSEGRCQLFFHVSLRRPTCLVGREPQIAASDQQYFICCRLALSPCHPIPLLVALEAPPERNILPSPDLDPLALPHQRFGNIAGGNDVDVKVARA